jgi:hypothetical protein
METCNGTLKGQELRRLVSTSFDILLPSYAGMPEKQ